MMKGRKAWDDRLKNLTSPAAIAKLEAALFNGGELLATEAQISLTRGAVSGKNHVASKPGEIPNQDTGVLGNNIEVKRERPLVVRVSSEAPYSKALEFGTSKMAARPFLRPARDKMAPEIRKTFARAVQAIVKEQ